MIFDIALFCAGIGLVILLSLPGRDEKDTIPHFIKTNLPGSGLVSGGLITVIKLVVLVRSFEQFDFKQNDIYFTQLLIMVCVNLRPLLFGVLLRLVFMPFNAPTTASQNPAPTAKTEPSAPGTQVCKPSPTTLLSRRELEVARLAAKGWTNTQIADQLFISVATVKRHLATIFEKLQISSRRELSNWF